ncbi:hypothetical protein RBSH_03772 [Rhodopirellula baltica SH28]|uniref:Uncharacterized protein n=1 Tax=Rhodopirellula baltica SH28 TaxID=993517 RepID=K5D2U2_RHOBT|nr:hypothetical protein RBSH_03772 [Rhodopirellula baltica SH28]
MVAAKGKCWFTGSSSFGEFSLSVSLFSWLSLKHVGDQHPEYA